MIVASSSDFGLSYVLEIVALVFVAYIVWKYVWAGGIGLRQMMNTRAESIRSDLAAGDEAEAAAAVLLERRREQLERAKAEAETIATQTSEAAAALVAEGERRSAEDYERIVQRADAEIQGNLARVRAEVTAEAGQLVMHAVEAVIEAELDSAAHHRLILEAIAATEEESV